MAIIKKPVVHQFPRAYANEFGINEAIVLKWLAYKTRKSRNYQDGKQWMFNSITKIAKQFPYLSRSQVNRAIDTLRDAGLVLVDNFNKFTQDKTQWYNVAQPHLDAVEADLITFDILEATKHGVPGAILLQNFQYWLQKEHKKGITNPSARMSPTVLSKLLPFLSKSTIKRELSVLVEKGIISRVHQTKPLYAFPELHKHSGDAGAV